jgi:hypothetical protein
VPKKIRESLEFIHKQQKMIDLGERVLVCLNREISQKSCPKYSERGYNAPKELSEAETAIAHIL